MEHKENTLKWAENDFWQGFFKEAAIKIPKHLPRMPKLPMPEGPPMGITRMSEAAAQAPVKTIKPATEALDYSKINVIERKAPSTIRYNSRGAQSYTPPQKA